MCPLIKHKTVTNLIWLQNNYWVNLISGGIGKIDIVDWKSNTRLKHCTADSPVVKWFWQIVESYSEEMRARLLQFVTGSSRVSSFILELITDYSYETEKWNNMATCYDNMKTVVCFRFRFKVLKLFKAPQVLLDLGCLPYIRLMHQL